MTSTFSADVLTVKSAVSASASAFASDVLFDVSSPASGVPLLQFLASVQLKLEPHALSHGDTPNATAAMSNDLARRPSFPANRYAMRPGSFSLPDRPSQ